MSSAYMFFFTFSAAFPNSTCIEFAWWSSTAIAKKGEQFNPNVTRLKRKIRGSATKISLHLCLLGSDVFAETYSKYPLGKIKAKIDARPLTFVGDDVKDADVLTPFHFLIGRPFVDIPMTPAPTVEENKLSLNRKWRSEYITTFVNRAKWLTKRQEPKEGDIVLVKEDSVKRDNWPLGRITIVIPGRDGLSRTVQVKTAKGIFTRPVAKLYLLEPADTEMKGETTKKIEELAKKLDRAKRRVNNLTMTIQHRCAENAEIERIEVMVAEMDKIFSDADALEGSYEELLNEDDLATKIEEWDTLHYAVMDARATFHTYKQKTMKQPVTETTEKKTTSGEGKEPCNLRIPKWQLTPFDGDIMQFGAFWDQFQASVHARTDLNDIEKFICLRSNLKGPALDVISGFSITATNYPEAVKTLRERFDRPDLIIQHHIVQIAEMKKVTELSPSGIRRQYDNIMLHLRALKAMGKDFISGQLTSTDILLALCQKIMPFEVNKKWEELIESNRNMSTTPESFLEFVRKQIDIEEKVTFTKGIKTTSVEKYSTTLNGNRSKGTPELLCWLFLPVVPFGVYGAAPDDLIRVRAAPTRPA
ncbi:hypothetical protein T10_1214 [Trichinella papuae]|uniref:DUF5641 domain-containing protein n=1 Tax=Trichinella papuae TaxID=268474 RepID=A0A0V1M328_9BILA|nr:hypothetical protein T10_1214 [Trichinella papuae]